MQEEVRENIQYFYVIGLSYRKSSVEIREKFALSVDLQKRMLEQAKNHYIESLAIVSTCNRTELYIYTKEEEKAVLFFLQNTTGSVNDFEKYGYILNAHEAIEHIFRVSNGMDSQILGDAQIISQVRQSFRLSQEYSMLNTFMERLSQHISRASKTIKRKTNLSSGVASVASAAVQAIQQFSTDLTNERLVLYGIGKIGKIACQNLLKYVPPHNITIINRTYETAQDIAAQMGVCCAKENELGVELNSAGALIVATSANEPTVRKEHTTKFSGIIVDLSVPRNVASDVEDSHIELVSIDDLQELSEEVKQQREDSIPKAEKIIESIIEEFYNWLQVKYMFPVFAELKKSLHSIKDEEVAFHKERFSDEEIKRVELLSSNIVDKVAEMCIAHLKDYHKKKMTPIETIESIFGLK